MSKFVLTAQLQLQAPKNVRQVVNQIQSQLQNVNVNVAVNNAAKSNKQLKTLSSSANQASNSFNKMGKSLSANVKRFTGLAIATRAVSLFTNSLGAAVRESINFERELIKVSQVTGKSVSQLSSLTKTITNLSTSLGVSSTSLLSVSRILAQTGLSARDTQTALATLARTELAPTFENITQTAEGAVAILNQFGQGAAALEAQLGSLNAVAGQFAVESGDLIAVIRRTGGVFKAAGGDLNELIALFTSVRATTRESSESIATGLRTIFTRIQRPKTIEFLKQYGVELLDLEGKFVGPFEAVRRLSQALQGLEQGDITFIEIAEQLGGFRQIGKVIPLLQQFSTAQAALNVAQQGSGSLASDAAKAQAALAVQITKVKEQFLQLIRSVTSSTTFQVMADTILKLTSALIKLADALSPIIPLLAAFAGVKMLGALGGGAGKMMGFNKGGKVMKFARGGSVPGTGNRDTVPAMLQPGEFVIKKSSVAKLGVDTLHRMNNNRFEDGGASKKLKSKQGMGSRFTIDKQVINSTLKAAGDKNVGDSDLDIGAAFLQPEGILKSVKATFAAKETNKLIDTVRKGLGSVNKGEVKELTKLGQSMSIDIQAGALQKSVAESFQTQLKSSITDFSSRFASTNLKGRPAFNKGKFGSAYNLANVAQVEGNIFEAFIGGLSDKPFNEERIAANATFDYPQGLGAASSVFGIDSNRIADAKRSFNSDALDSLSKKGMTRIVEGFKSTVAQQLIAKAKASDKNFDKNSTTGKARTKAASKDVLTKTLNSGGPAGPDTVPALLTPGEFVVNRQSAQKIGYGKLAKMNKVAKFNKGGAVGIQRFENGGGVGEAATFSVQGLMALSETSMITAQSLTSLVTAIINTAATQNQISQANVTQLASIGQITQAEATAAATTLKNNDVNLKKLGTTNQEIKASLEAAKADQEEAKASKMAADEDENSINQTKKTQKGMDGLLMGFMALQTALALLTPTIDETSGPMDYLLNSLSTLAMQITTVGFLLTTDFAKSIVKSALAVSMGLGSKLLPSIFGSAVALRAQAAASAAAAGADATEATGSMAAYAADLIEAGASLLNALMSPAGALIALGVAIAAVVAAVYFWNDAVAKSAEAESKRAQEKGDIGGAEAAAGKQADAEATRDATGKGVAAFFMGFSGIFAPFAIAADLSASAIISEADSRKNIKAALISQAGAQAALTASSKALQESQKTATDAMKAFKDGTMTASEALSQTRDSTAAVALSQEKVRKANLDAQRAVITHSSVMGDFFKGLTFGLTSFGFGTTEERQKKADEESEARNAEQEKLERDAVAQNQPMINALGKQTAVGGGDFDTFFQRLQLANPELAKLADQKELRKAFENIQKEVDRAKAAFEAMNLGFQGVNAAASAAAHSVDMLVGGFDGSVSQIESTIATLKAGITNAAQGLDDGVFESALDSAASSIERLGGDATKFKENLGAINQAQKFFVNASEEAKASLQAEFSRGAGGAGNAAERRAALGNAIVGQMDGVGQDVKDRILDAVEGADIKQEDLDAILDGDMDVLDKVLKDLGETTLNQVLPALQNLAKVEKQLADVQTRRLALEDKYISAIQRQIDVTLEAADIMAEFGGAAVTPEQRSQGIVSQLNASGSALGLSQMRTGSADEIRQRNKEIAEQQAAMQKVRADAAGGDKAAQAEINDPAFKAREERLNKAAEENYQKTKQLIDVKRQELKVIEAKNAAEKKATEALLGNNIEEFLDQMAGKGAASAAALGSPQLAAQFGMSAFGTANKQLEEMQNAGVTSFMGQDISGVRQNAVGFGAMSAGMGFDAASSMAQATTGTSPEAEAAKSAARDLASTLPQSTGNLMNSTKNMLEATKILEAEVETKVEEAVDNVEKRAEAATTPPPSGPPAPPPGETAAVPAAPTSEGGSLINQANTMTLDPTVSSPAAGATPPPDQQAESKPSQVQSEFERIQKQVEGDVQKVFVVNLNEMSSLASAMFSSPLAMPDTGGASVANVGQGGGGMVDSLISGITAPLTAVSNVGATIGETVSTAVTAPFSALQAAINPLTAIQGNLNTSIQGLTGALSGGVFDFSALDGLSENFTRFNESFKAQIDRLQATSINVAVAPATVNVNLNGGEFLSAISKNIRKEIMGEVTQKLGNLKLDAQGNIVQGTSAGPSG